VHHISRALSDTTYATADQTDGQLLQMAEIPGQPENDDFQH